MSPGKFLKLSLGVALVGSMAACRDGSQSTLPENATNQVRVSHAQGIEETNAQVSTMGRKSLAQAKASSQPTSAVQPPERRHPLLDYKFTNEFGQSVSISQFQGQALAYTFFYTRCPVPDYCPRLSKNFAEASQKLLSMPNAPTNWHFLSITIDPEIDAPGVLRAYAERYHYASNRWTFLTGPASKITELARASGFDSNAGENLANHGFRTVIVDAAGRIQMVYPVVGNLSDAIVTEVLKAAAARE